MGARRCARDFERDRGKCAAEARVAIWGGGGNEVDGEGRRKGRGSVLVLDRFLFSLPAFPGFQLAMDVDLSRTRADAMRDSILDCPWLFGPAGLDGDGCVGAMDVVGVKRGRCGMAAMG